MRKRLKYHHDLHWHLHCRHGHGHGTLIRIRRWPSIGEIPVRKDCVEDEGSDKEDGKDGNPVIDVKSDKVQDKDYGGSLQTLFDPKSLLQPKN